MKCEKCGLVSPEGSKTCENCGEVLGKKEFIHSKTPIIQKKKVVKTEIKKPSAVLDIISLFLGSISLVLAGFIWFESNIYSVWVPLILAGLTIILGIIYISNSTKISIGLILGVIASIISSLFLLMGNRSHQKMTLTTYNGEIYHLKYNQYFKEDKTSPKLKLVYYDDTSYLADISYMENSDPLIDINNKKSRQNIIETYLHTFQKNAEYKITNMEPEFKKLNDENFILEVPFEYGRNGCGAYYVIVSKYTDKFSSFIAFLTKKERKKEFQSDVVGVLKSFFFNSIKEKEKVEELAKYGKIGEILKFEIPKGWEKREGGRTALVKENHDFYKMKGQKIYMAVDAGKVVVSESEDGSTEITEEDIIEMLSNVQANETAKKITVGNIVWNVLTTKEFNYESEEGKKSKYFAQIAFHLSPNDTLYKFTFIIPKNAKDNLKSRVNDDLEFIISRAELRG